MHVLELYLCTCIQYYIITAVKASLCESRERGGRQDERKPGDECKMPHQTENPAVGHRHSAHMTISFGVRLSSFFCTSTRRVIVDQPHQ